MTGADLYKYFQESFGAAYVGYLDTTKANRLFKDALFQSIEFTYRNLDDTQRYDKLNTLIKANVAKTPANNEVVISGTTSVLTDYLHLLRCNATFEIAQSGITIEEITQGILVTSWFTNLREGQQVLIGITTNHTSVGTFYLRRAGKFHWSLWTDKTFKTPYTSTVSVTGLSIYFQYDNPCIQMLSDEKSAVLEAATVDYPKYELANGVLRIYPLEETATKTTLDYLTKAVNPYGWDTPIDISDTNTAHDLELIYTYNFLTQIVIDFAQKLFSKQVRDTEFMGVSTQDIKQNL